jgi:hypothetical protein
VKKIIIGKYAAALVLIVLVLFFAQVQIVHPASEPDRAFSFVGGALFNSQYQVRSSGEWAYAGDINGTVVMMNVSGYTIESFTDSLSISCAYYSKGQGLWYVTLNVGKSSQGLPTFAQVTANPVDRARDFIKRYMSWKGNESLDVAKNMLDSVDTSQNTTKTFSTATNQWRLTVTSSPYCISLYWSYTPNVVNGKPVANEPSYRGLGITFAGKYVFFRDDGNLPFPPLDAPATVFNSISPYGLGVEFPSSGSTGVPVNTTFTMTTTRPAPIMDLYLNPNVEVAGVKSETRQYSGNYTFKLATRLESNTGYTATVIYGQDTPASFDSAPVSIKSWTFTTGESLPFDEVSAYGSPSADASKLPTGSFLPSSTGQSQPKFNIKVDYVPLIELAAVVAVVAVSLFLLSRKLRL